MAQLTTKKLAYYDVPTSIKGKGFNTITWVLDPTRLSADVTSGDNILIATIDKNARVVGASIRTTDTDAMDSPGFLQLQITENGVSTAITPPVTSIAANSVAQAQAPPAVDTRYTKTLELVVGGAAINQGCTTGALIIVNCTYDYYKGVLAP